MPRTACSCWMWLLCGAGTELARGHVLDHALAQWADSIDGHGKLLSRMRLTNTSILGTGLPARHR